MLWLTCMGQLRVVVGIVVNVIVTVNESVDCVCWDLVMMVISVVVSVYLADSECSCVW